MKIEKCVCGETPRQGKKSPEMVSCRRRECQHIVVGETEEEAVIMWNAAQRALKQKGEVRRGK